MIQQQDPAKMRDTRTPAQKIRDQIADPHPSRFVGWSKLAMIGAVIAQHENYRNSVGHGAADQAGNFEPDQPVRASLNGPSFLGRRLAHHEVEDYEEER